MLRRLGRKEKLEALEILYADRENSKELAACESDGFAVSHSSLILATEISDSSTIPQPPPEKQYIGSWTACRSSEASMTVKKNC